MKTIVPVLVASALLIGGAYAQSPAASQTVSRSADTSSSAMMKSGAQHSVEIDKHIKDLHAKLKITPAQESQWDTVAQTMRDNARELDEAIEKREARVNNGTAVDDLNAYGDIVQAHANAIKKLATAFASLYASMPDEQKKLADSVFVHRIPGKNVATKSSAKHHG